MNQGSTNYTSRPKTKATKHLLRVPPFPSALPLKWEQDRAGAGPGDSPQHCAGTSFSSEQSGPRAGKAQSPDRGAQPGPTEASASPIAGQWSILRIGLQRTPSRGGLHVGVSPRCQNTDLVPAKCGFVGESRLRGFSGIPVIGSVCCDNDVTKCQDISARRGSVTACEGCDKFSLISEECRQTHPPPCGCRLSRGTRRGSLAPVGPRQPVCELTRDTAPPDKRWPHPVLSRKASRVTEDTEERREGRGLAAEGARWVWGASPWPSRFPAPDSVFSFQTETEPPPSRRGSDGCKGAPRAGCGAGGLFQRETRSHVKRVLLLAKAQDPLSSEFGDRNLACFPFLGEGWPDSQTCL